MNTREEREVSAWSSFFSLFLKVEVIRPLRRVQGFRTCLKSLIHSYHGVTGKQMSSFKKVDHERGNGLIYLTKRGCLIACPDDISLGL